MPHPPCPCRKQGRKEKELMGAVIISPPWETTFILARFSFHVCRVLSLGPSWRMVLRSFGWLGRRWIGRLFDCLIDCLIGLLFRFFFWSVDFSRRGKKALRKNSFRNWPIATVFFGLTVWAGVFRNTVVIVRTTRSPVHRHSLIGLADLDH